MYPNIGSTSQSYYYIRCIQKDVESWIGMALTLLSRITAVIIVQQTVVYPAQHVETFWEMLQNVDVEMQGKCRCLK